MTFVNSLVQKDPVCFAMSKADRNLGPARLQRGSWSLGGPGGLLEPPEEGGFGNAGRKHVWRSLFWKWYSFHTTQKPVSAAKEAPKILLTIETKKSVLHS